MRCWDVVGLFGDPPVSYNLSLWLPCVFSTTPAMVCFVRSRTYPLHQYSALLLSALFTMFLDTGQCVRLISLMWLEDVIISFLPPRKCIQISH